LKEKYLQTPPSTIVLKGKILRLKSLYIWLFSGIIKYEPKEALKGGNMTNFLKRNVLKPLTLLIFTIFICTFSFSYVIANRGEETYENPGDKVLTTESNIVESAGYFLQGYADYVLILNRIELSNQQGIDYTEMQILVDRVIYSMENAKNSYFSLIKRAVITPYKVEMINKLKSFDYNKFCNDEHLINSIFSDTTSYLSNGNVTEVFKKLLLGTEHILSKLQGVKAAVDVEKFPDLSIIWQLNQEFSYHLIFGQYAAQVFFKISK